MADVKPGFKTTEWWALVAVLLLGVLLQSGYFGEQHWVTKAATYVSQIAAALGYSFARAKTKFGASIGGATGESREPDVPRGDP